LPDLRPETASKISGGLLRWAAYLLVMALPWLFLSGSYDVLVQEKLPDLVPYAHWDPYDYCLEARAFHAVGFKMGRFTLNEETPPLTGSPFGPHSFMYPMVLSIGAWLTEAAFPFSAPMANMVIMGLCLGAYLFLTRPSYLHLGFLALVIVSLDEFPHFGATFWEESTHYSLAFLLAALLYRMLLAGNAKAKRRWGAALNGILVVAALTRPTWGLLFPAFFAMALPISRSRWLISLALGGLSFLGCTLLYQQTASPFVSYIDPGRQLLGEILHGHVAFLELPRQIASLVIANGRQLLALIANAPFIGLIFFYLLVGYVAILITRPYFKNVYNSERISSDLEWIHLTVVGGLLPFALFLGQIEVRHIFSCYLVSLLLLSRLNVSRTLVVFMVGAQIAFMATNFQIEQDRAYDLAKSPQARMERIARFSELAEQLMPFTPQKNSWCNTMLVGNHDTVTEYLGLPAGIGLSHVLTYTSYVPPAKSRFLLLKNDWHVNFFKGANTLMFLSHTTAGDLYCNTDCGCEGPPIVPMSQEDLSAGVAELEKLDAVRSMATYPFGKGLTWRGLTLLSGNSMIEATLELDLTALTRAQNDAGLITAERAEQIRDKFDRMDLLATFARSPGSSPAPRNLRLYVHCRGGLFNTYDLPAKTFEDLAAGRPFDPVSLKYNELDKFICDYW
jgi:hypothetical protein